MLRSPKHGYAAEARLRRRARWLARHGGFGDRRVRSLRGSLFAGLYRSVVRAGLRWEPAGGGLLGGALLCGFGW
ncbi:hypothetical protein GCM10027271_07190 [Saccharopolyspora gloriosae]|uniref:Uncharacterized protein n=1 Tax=Saccharopolyspora gloriosae TaxID=455344 RepID=A0A840NVW2_9PSEU|nr:hypothetical protein [Saccharopolyspora gloriosae]